MRGKLSDQDLTDYALNELDPNERLYVESMLAVSEECRNDIYEMIDVGMMIEEGFDAAGDGETIFGLTPEQRQALLNVPLPNRLWQRSAAMLAVAAAVALMWTSKEAWLPKNSASAVSEVARVSTQMKSYMVEAVSAAEGEDFVSQLASFRKFTQEPSSFKWLPAQSPGGAAVLGATPSLNVDSSARASFDLMP